MRYHALATDYDGTIAHHGKVDDNTLDALKKLKASGRKLILVTGRELDDLKKVFSDLTIFDLVIAENGALLYRPTTFEEKPLGEAPPQIFIDELKKREVSPLSVGRVIVATWEPNEKKVLEAIKETGVERQVIFNKGAVMILPSGLNKERGVMEALTELKLSPHNVVAVGDAENDNALLAACGFGVAVSNALPSLKEKADWVTPSDHGKGVGELIEEMIKTDLKELDEKRDGEKIVLGKKNDGSNVTISPYGKNILLAGSSGGGKSTFTTAFLEHLLDLNYQFCLIDPEGDYENLEGSIVLGDANHPPLIEDVLRLLEVPSQNAVVCTLAIPFNDRPAFFQRLLPALLTLRSRTGRPHWIIIDEAHHLTPSIYDDSLFNIPGGLQGLFLITTKPNLLNKAVLELVHLVVAIGQFPHETLNTYSSALGIETKNAPEVKLERGEAICWWREPEGEPFWMQSDPPKTERKRHLRKYSEGELGDHSFYFTGPNGRLKLRAQNLMIFIQMAEGVDDETWMYHLKRNEYSQWFRDAIKDDRLAETTQKIEEKESSPEKSREAIFNLIKKHYTGPA